MFTVEVCSHKYFFDFLIARSGLPTAGSLHTWLKQSSQVKEMFETAQDILMGISPDHISTRSALHTEL